MAQSYSLLLDRIYGDPLKITFKRHRPTAYNEGENRQYAEDDERDSEKMVLIRLGVGKMSRPALKKRKGG
jgi:hypothetical protein